MACIIYEMNETQNLHILYIYDFIIISIKVGSFWKEIEYYYNTDFFKQIHLVPK